MLEIEQIASRADIDAKFFMERIDRIIRYFKNLENSFEIMVDGMEKEQFLKFRMALLPASGFQSAQYRFIEIGSTDLINLVGMTDREALRNSESLSEMVDKLYWKFGATDLATGKKTLTLQQFENKYMADFAEAATRYKDKNLRQIFVRNFQNVPEKDRIIERLKEYDTYVNIYWPLAHLKSAGRYLKKDPEDIKATGGTNWQKYLPPRFQRRMFFPEFWSPKEQDEWGIAALKRQFASETDT
jgi:tryptophan 2,3-dioxygenase